MHNFFWGVFFACIGVYLLGLMFLARFFMDAAIKNPHVKDTQSFVFVSIVAYFLWLTWPISLMLGMFIPHKKK